MMKSFKYSNLTIYYSRCIIKHNAEIECIYAYTYIVTYTLIALVYLAYTINKQYFNKYHLIYYLIILIQYFNKYVYMRAFSAVLIHPSAM